MSHLSNPYLRVALAALFLLFAPQLLEAQTARQYMKMGDASVEDGDYYGAAHYYKKAIDTDSTELVVYFKYAEALRSFNEYEKAGEAYGYVHDRDNAKLREFPQALFWQASMAKYMGRYDEAIDLFNEYLTVAIIKSDYFYKKAKHELESCAFAKDLMANEVDVEVKNAGGLINSIGSEFSVLMKRDSVIWFSSLSNDSVNANNEVESNHYYVRVWEATKVGDTWQRGERLDTTINHPLYHAANGTFSLDSSRFYYSRCTGLNQCAIWMSRWIGSGWGSPVKLDEAVNLPEFSSTQPHIARMDGRETLIFASNRPGTRGKYDLWYSVVQEAGRNHSKAKNFGTAINTIDNEITPFVDPATDTMYFSSDWHNGLGGFDVFKVAGGLKPGKPENLGYPINTSVNDFYYVIDTLGKSGFLTSNRVGSITAKGETCCNDIWQVEFPVEIPVDTVPAEVPVIVSTDPRIPIPELTDYLPTLYFHNDEPNPRNWDTTTTLNYLDAYESYRKLTETYKSWYSRGIAQDPELAKAAMDSFFVEKVDYGVEVMEVFAEKLLAQLDSGQQVEVTIKGYASPLAKTNYNVNLTKRRIASFKNYLREYKDGAYVPYLDETATNGARLDIISIPYGEYKADKSVSANANDQRNSIYSIKAGMERKIEVLSVTKPNPNAQFPIMAFNEQIHDFGKVTPGQKLKRKFWFINAGTASLDIESVEPECGCTVAKWPDKPVLPGEIDYIELTFDTSDKLGNQLKTAIIRTNGDPKVKELTITAEILLPEDMPW